MAWFVQVFKRLLISLAVVASAALAGDTDSSIAARPALPEIRNLRRVASLLAWPIFHPFRRRAPSSYARWRFE